MNTNDKEIGQQLYNKGVQFINQKYPTGWGGCAVMYTKEKEILLSVYLEAPNAAAELCMETGAICEAQKLDLHITHSLCLSRENENSPLRILTACGICQERLRYWGENVKVAVTNPNNDIIFKTLNELSPYHWKNAFKQNTK